MEEDIENNVAAEIEEVKPNAKLKVIEASLSLSLSIEFTFIFSVIYP